MTVCPRCAVLEDLLETARRQVDAARVEGEKADDEALHWKTVAAREDVGHARRNYAAIKGWQGRAIAAEAALAAGSRRAKTPKAVECGASQSGPKGNAQ